MCGLSGSGKTFNSKILEKSLDNYKIIGPGIIRENLGIRDYSRKDTPRLLAKVIEEIENNHFNGIGSIIDANLKSVDLRQCFYDLAKHLGIQVIVIETTCSDILATERMNSRIQTTKAENPKESEVYFNQKKIWQDLSLDLNNHNITWINLDSSTDKAIIMAKEDSSLKFVSEIISILENKPLNNTFI